MSVFDHDEQIIHQALTQIQVDPDKIYGQVKGRLQERQIPRSLLRRAPRAAAMAASLLLVVLVTATATALTNFEWFQERFNPTFSTIIESVEAVCEDQGIRMEVIGAQSYDNMAIVYLSLQDVSGQNRLTERTDFRDGFSVKTDQPQLLAEPAADGSDTVTSSMQWRQNLLYFDSANNTAYFEFKLTTDANSPLADPLELGSFLIYFDITNYENEPIPVTLTELSPAELVPLAEENLFGYGGSDLEDWQAPEEVLAPGYYAPMPHGQADQWISNIAMVDGQLHVQLGKVWNQEFGSSDVAFSLSNTAGELLSNTYEITLLSTADNQWLHIQEDDYAEAAYVYSEYVFDLDEAQLPSYTLCFTSSVSTGVEGNWKVAAHLSDTSRQMRIWTNDLAVEGHLFEQFTLSPLGLEVLGRYEGEQQLASEMTLALETASGGLIPLSGGGGGHSAHTFSLHWDTEEPIDVASVTAVLINGVRIPVE